MIAFTHTRSVCRYHLRSFNAGVLAWYHGKWARAKRSRWWWDGWCAAAYGNVRFEVAR